MSSGAFDNICCTASTYGVEAFAHHRLQVQVHCLQALNPRVF